MQPRAGLALRVGVVNGLTLAALALLTYLAAGVRLYYSPKGRDQ